MKMHLLMYKFCMTFLFGFALIHADVELTTTQVVESSEMEGCFISFIEHDGTHFIVKQLKDTSPDEQFILVLDALGC